ncbi:MAG: restriction endonuclease [Planctomycetes bacterium B3_Pla]|nr:MAG: restriction endonuclease [Planctomycetes bacterium B3_Pla]
MSIDITFHYPPELMNLLIDVIPLLNRSKKDVFLFFKGAGISQVLMSAPHKLWKQNPSEITKYEIVRQILTKLNEKGELCLRERREVLKRVIEFENFSACWESDKLKAKGLVAEIRDVVNVKDSFTRMNIERVHERQIRLEKEQAEKEALQQRQRNIDQVRNELFQLFSIQNPQKRGKTTEAVLNNLFKVFEIGIRDAFALVGNAGEGVLEQIDGVVEFDSHIYFVEMKWWSDPLGTPEVSQHLVRIYHRTESRAIIISASDFTAPAVNTCREALHHKVVVLCTLREIVMLLERKGDLKDLLKKKVRSAIIDKNPFDQVL